MGYRQMQNLIQAYPVAVLTLFVLCGAVPSYAQHQGCIDATGPCHAPHPGLGCACPSCCEIVCDLDSFCCETQWDSVCSSYASDACWGDCDDNGIPDDCDPDCNGNGLADDCDLDDGTSEDCDSNGIPDECDSDCNRNGIPDGCDDCNGNRVPDVEDISAGTSEDCNANCMPDECDDCNMNGIPDVQDITSGTSGDCNANCTPDECETDCNSNGVFDACDIAEGTSVDCNLNDIPDECESDCNNNGIPDPLEVCSGVSADCNLNYIPDECEFDCDGNDIPDLCDVDLDCNNNDILDQNEAPVFCPGSSPIPVDLIVIADSSGSDSGKMPDLCSMVFRTAVTRLRQEFDVRAIWTSVSQVAPESGCHDFTIPLDTEVPVCDSVPPRIIDDDDGEEWGDATAIMTTPYEDHLLGKLGWDERDAVLILIPISDEGPQDGGTGDFDDACGCSDALSVLNLIRQAWIENAQIVPMPTRGTSNCLYFPNQPRRLMSVVANETGGSVVDARYWPDPGYGSAELSLKLEDALRAAIAVSPRIVCPCTGDCNNDRMVDGADLTIVLAAWGTSDPNGDLNDDGMVDGADVTIVLAAWGACP